ncbi:MAG: glycosyl hydrolase 108 family protein [Pseudomonadota bacterium]
MTVMQLVDEIIGREGGYSNHPADRGGPTRWGVTEQVARSFGYAGDMRNLSRDIAVHIYVSRYWTGPKFDQVAAIYPKVAEELFDTGVNMGPAVAAKFLQRALNALNRGAVDYPDIAADGQIGAMTIFALQGYQAKRGAIGEAVLLKALDALQGARYIDITEGRSANEAFLYGWLANRVGALA